MELWVRSQTREKIIRVNNVSVFWENDWFIVANITNDLQEFKEMIVLGEYKSKERALEVLDEIQCHLVNINDSRDSYFYVYKMPEE